MDKFEEIKIRMVMKLKKMTRRAAVKEIARMAAEKRKAIEEEMAEAAAVESELKEKRAAMRRRRSQSANISRMGFEPISDFFS